MKAYTTDEIRNLAYSTVSAMRHALEMKIIGMMTEEEVKIVHEAAQYTTAPYSMQRNPLQFQPGKEKEAEEREMHIANVISQAEEIKMRIQNSLPKAELTTFASILKVQNGQG